MSELPTATVIVPTRERPAQLLRCLAAVAALAYPREKLEAVVVDDGGGLPAPPPAEIRERLDLRVIRREGRGPAVARNAGAAAAKGELLAFTDDDCEPEPGWLAELAKRVGDSDERMAGGRTVNALAANRYSAASQAITDSVYAHYNTDPERAGFLASNNIAMRAAAFRALGGYDERFTLAAGEDRDLCERWLERGGTLVYEPAAVVRHSHELDLGGFWGQHFGYGRGTFLQRRLRAERGGGFELAPAATSGVLADAARRSLAERRPSRLALLAVWQLGNAAGFARQALAARPTTGD